MYSTAGWTVELVPKLDVELLDDLDLLRQQQNEVKITSTAIRPPMDCAKFAKMNSGKYFSNPNKFGKVKKQHEMEMVMKFFSI